MKLSFRRGPRERVIYLDEDVYVVIGDPGRAGTQRSAWPATGSYGPIPGDGAIGQLDDVLGNLGPELWRAKRRGPEACLITAVATFDAAAALAWGADCVDHLARRVRGVDGNVVETLALARRYARDRKFDAGTARRLAREAETTLVRLRNDGVWSAGRALVSRAVELEVGVGLLNPAETEYEAREGAIAAQRAMQVALMHATQALCGADPLVAGREAARWSRRASARNALAQESSYRATAAKEASWWNLWLNPFASGTLARSLPGQVKAIQDGDLPETEWQAGRLAEYLNASDGPPLPLPPGTAII